MQKKRLTAAEQRTEDKKWRFERMNDMWRLMSLLDLEEYTHKDDEDFDINELNLGGIIHDVYEYRKYLLEKGLLSFMGWDKDDLQEAYDKRDTPTLIRILSQLFLEPLSERDIRFYYKMIDEKPNMTLEKILYLRDKNLGQRFLRQINKYDSYYAGIVA